MKNFDKLIKLELHCERVHEILNLLPVQLKSLTLKECYFRNQYFEIGNPDIGSCVEELRIVGCPWRNVNNLKPILDVFPKLKNLSIFVLW